MHRGTIRKIIWAVDAFERRSLPHKNAINALRIVSRKTGASILPVYVLSPAELNLSLEFTPPWIQQYQPAAKASLKELVQNSKLQNIEEPKVLVQNIATKRKSVDALTAYAKKQNADLIVVATHARRGVARFFLGSFAETLILNAQLPVLVVGPKLIAKREFKRVLFPTDLGPVSEKTLLRLLPLVKQMGARLTLFHSAPSPVEPVVQSSIYLLGGAWVPVHRYFLEELSARKKKLQALAQKIKAHGFRVDIDEDDTGDNISASILKVARNKKMDLVAMAGQSGAIASTLLGSITRQVVRHAGCPVWILHPIK